MGKENSQLVDPQDIFKNNPEILAIINPFIERRQKINLEFLPEGTFISRLPDLNRISQEYLSSLDLFRTSPKETNSQVLDRIRDSLYFYHGRLPIEEKISYQEARRFIHSLYPEKFGQWTAVWALSLKYLSGMKEFFKKPNIFDIRLTFYEYGVKPIDSKDGPEENFYLHLPIGENGKKFFGCWLPGEMGISHYHRIEEKCLQRVAFKR